MTEKRYELKCHEINSWYIEKDGKVLIFDLFKSDGEILYAELNSLSDKNEQLKQEKQELFDFFMNEYDRQEDESIDREIKLEEHIKSLIDVNEQLKKELFEVKKDYLIETADISDKIYLDNMMEELRREMIVKDGGRLI